jgi:nicotinamide-nucleotide amidase
MAWGMKTRSGADWTIAVTGIAGPDGGSPEKPVGTVWIAWCNPSGIVTSRLFHFEGNREDIRRSTTEEALAGLLEML